MKKTSLLISLVAITQLTFAKFTDIQKDTCLKFLSFSSASYGINIRFYETDYIPLPDSPFKGKSEEKIIAELKGDFRDASAYKQICLLNMEKQDFANAEKNYLKALELYNEWLNSADLKPKVLQEIFDLFYGVNQYQYIPDVIKIAEDKFPNDLKLLQQFCLFSFNVEKEFPKAKAYLQRAMAIEPQNLTNLTYYAMIPYFEGITQLNQTGECGPMPAFDLIKKNWENNKNKLEFEHLFHFSSGLKAYLMLTCNFVKRYQTDKKANLFIIKEPVLKNELDAAAAFFKKALKTKHPNKPNLYNSLGSVLVFQNKRKEAYQVFNQCFAETKNMEALEAMILLSVIEDKPDFALLEKNFNAIVEQTKDTNHYASLVSILMKHKQEQKAEKYVQLVEQSKNLNENGVKLLNTWFLEKRDFKRADYYLEFFSKESESFKWRSMVAALLKDNAEEVKKWFTELEKDDPNDEDLTAFKKIVGL